jgi:mannan endo-1,4-beta-mannosidase
MVVNMLLISLLYLGLCWGYPDYLLSSKDPDPPRPMYPTGTQSGTFAKVSGRLFDIDGKTGYFSGTVRAMLKSP